MAADRLPDWLLQARADLPSRSVALEIGTHSADPVVGGVYVAQHVDAAPIDRRMVMVLTTSPDIGIADVALVSNETDMATDCDVVVPGNVAGSGFDLMFQTDLIAPMFMYQLERFIGRVELDVADIVQRALDSECAKIPAGWRGLPIARDDDPRWQFKSEELTALQALAADCVEWVVGGGPERDKYVSSDLLVATTSIDSWERASAVVELGDLLDRGWQVPVNLLETIFESDLDVLTENPDVMAVLSQLQPSGEWIPDVDSVEMEIESDQRRTGQQSIAHRRLSASLMRRGVSCARIAGRTGREQSASAIHERARGPAGSVHLVYVKESEGV